MGAELFHADGRTDRHDKANSRFPQFWKRAQKMGCVINWTKTASCSDLELQL